MGTGALEHGLDGQPGDEPHHAELVEVAEARGVVGEQPLGDQLEQDVVVALEGGEHVSVRAQGAEPVGHQVAGATARLPALLDRPAGVPGADRLGAGRQRLQGPALPVGGVGGREHVVQLGQQLLLGEVQRVGLREQRQQPPLVHAVVEQQLLLVGVRRAELTALVGVLDRHGERHLAGRDAGAADADPSLDQGAEHREEPAVLVLDAGDVAAVLGDVGVAVEQVGARDPDAVEPDPSVVDAVEPDLGAVVLDADAGQRLSLLVADRHDERVHALGAAVDLELGEHHRHRRVRGGVADVVLAREIVRSRDHELLRVVVVRRDGAQRLHVGTMARLGHREAAQQVRPSRGRPGRRRGGASSRAGGSPHRTGRTGPRP